MRGRVGVVASLILSAMAFGAFGQSTSQPYWLLYDQGLSLVDKKELGEALQKFQASIALNKNFPEAELAIGDIYREEGETDLAIRQYQKAYKLKNYFYISDSKYDVLYKMARIYLEQQLYTPMEDSLTTIIQDDKAFNEPTTSRLKEQIESNYYAKGIDFVAKLYRFQTFFAEQAHADLGWFYYRSGRFSLSVLHLLYSVISKISEAAQLAASNDVDFQFTTLEQLMKLSETDKDIARYFRDYDIYKDLYYLAGSTYATGYPEHASVIWKILSSTTSGAYKQISEKQLKSPWIETYLERK